MFSNIISEGVTSMLLALVIDFRVLTFNLNTEEALDIAVPGLRTTVFALRTYRYCKVFFPVTGLAILESPSKIFVLSSSEALSSFWISFHQLFFYFASSSFLIASLRFFRLIWALINPNRGFLADWDLKCMPYNIISERSIFLKATQHHNTQKKNAKKNKLLQ